MRDDLILPMQIQSVKWETLQVADVDDMTFIRMKDMGGVVVRVNSERGWMVFRIRSPIWETVEAHLGPLVVGTPVLVAYRNREWTLASVLRPDDFVRLPGVIWHSGQNPESAVQSPYPRLKD